MQIDPEGKAAQGITGFLEFVALNVVYLLACIPVVTIGAASSALLEVTMRFSDEERGKPLPDFFPALWRNLKPATIAHAVLGLSVVALAFAGLFWVNQATIVTTVLGFVSFIAAAYLSAAWWYAMALIARYRNTMRQTLRNAVLLPGAEPTRTFGLMLLPVTVLAMLIIYPALWFVVVTIGFAVGAYAASFILRSVFRRHS